RIAPCPPPLAVRPVVARPAEVPHTALNKGRRLAPVAPRADPKHLLADRLAGPEGLARPVVAEDDEEAAQDRDQVRDRVQARRSDRDRREIDAGQDAEKDEQVEDLGDAARREAVDLVVERHPLRRRDHELAVGKRLAHLLVIVMPCAQRTSWLSAEMTGTVSKTCSAAPARPTSMRFHPRRSSPWRRSTAAPPPTSPVPSGTGRASPYIAT